MKRKREINRERGRERYTIKEKKDKEKEIDK